MEKSQWKVEIFWVEWWLKYYKLKSEGWSKTLLRRKYRFKTCKLWTGEIWSSQHSSQEVIESKIKLKESRREEIKIKIDVNKWENRTNKSKFGSLLRCLKLASPHKDIKGKAQIILEIKKKKSPEIMWIKKMIRDLWTTLCQEIWKQKIFLKKPWYLPHITEDLNMKATQILG